MSKILNYVFTFLALPGLASAQSSLGVNQAQAVVETAPDATTAEAQIDILFTPNHGLQGDLGLARYDETSIGYLAGHLYLSTNQNQKYGLFGSYHDWDDTSQSMISGGIEGLFALGNQSAVGFHAGLGKMDPGEIDFVFAGVSWVYDVSTDLRLTARASITDIDEARFSTTAQTIEFASEYQITRPVTLSAGLRHTRLSGTYTDQKTEAFLGLKIGFGRNSSTVRSTPFHSPQPLQAYWQRGLAIR
ncbi:hypothetical protein [Actibacterium pelagium]|uniref:Uncharacterized protein n=1 Tax=Actibacterium pelagium TaxID=2029103 RepID=A0A917EHF9_9RHOB|nr:hypothetical protein [Actibacterium pelagium]GGE42489.1 hypothetical protein GCM10011517_07540 [Actibacterium pelagium]